MMDDSALRERYLSVLDRLGEAIARAGRKLEEVRLIAVSKLHPAEDVACVAAAGQVDFGENYVQEALQKRQDLVAQPQCRDIRWHMIGHLQRNKVKYIVGKVALIHSVDTYRLAEEINIQAKKRGIIVPILVEVNIAGEETKFGTTAEDAMLLVEEISKLENVRIRGLMTIAPFVENPEDNRLYFRKIKQLSVDITNKNIDNVSMEILSMGMTGDYEVAIEEGATMVRVGTGIFGARNYKKSNESH